MCLRVQSAESRLIIFSCLDTVRKNKFFLTGLGLRLVLLSVYFFAPLFSCLDTVWPCAPVHVFLLLIDVLIIV